MGEAEVASSTAHGKQVFFLKIHDLNKHKSKKNEWIRKAVVSKVMNCFLGRSETLSRTLYLGKSPPKELPSLSSRKLMRSLVWRTGDFSIHRITKWSITNTLWKWWVEIAPLMMDLREINTTRPEDVGKGMEIINGDIIEMPWMSADKWLGFSTFSSQTEGASKPPPAGTRISSPTLHFMTQICQFILSGPFVKWDLHSSAKCSHNRHYGSITSQSRFGERALFFHCTVWWSQRAQIHYILPQNHTRFLWQQNTDRSQCEAVRDPLLLRPWLPRSPCQDSLLRLSPSHVSQGQAST